MHADGFDSFHEVSAIPEPAHSEIVNDPATAPVFGLASTEFGDLISSQSSGGELQDAAGANTAKRRIADCTVREMTKVATPGSVESDALRPQEQSQHLPPAGNTARVRSESK